MWTKLANCKLAFSVLTRKIEFRDLQKEERKQKKTSQMRHSCRIGNRKHSISYESNNRISARVHKPSVQSLEQRKHNGKKIHRISNLCSSLRSHLWASGIEAQQCGPSCQASCFCSLKLTMRIPQAQVLTERHHSLESS